MTVKSVIAALALCAVASSAYAQQPAATAKPAKHIDSLWNGALIGAGIGVVGAWIFTRVNCGPRGYDDECSLIAGPYSTAILVPAGAIGGAIIDRLINKTLPPSANAHTSIAPLVSQSGNRKKVGVALKLNIRF